VPWTAFLLAFGDSEDALIAELVELVEHQPRRGGLLGAPEAEFKQHEAAIEAAIAVLETKS
jgi:hypothetical protein